MAYDMFALVVPCSCNFIMKFPGSLWRSDMGDELLD